MGREGLGLGGGGRGATTTVTILSGIERVYSTAPTSEGERVFFAGYSVAAATAEGQHFSFKTEGQ